MIFFLFLILKHLSTFGISNKMIHLGSQQSGLILQNLKSTRFNGNIPKRLRYQCEASLMGTMMKSLSKMFTDLVQRLTRAWRFSAALKSLLSSIGWWRPFLVGNKKWNLYLEWQEPWSSGNGRRLMCERSWVWIPPPFTRWTWHIFTLICCKNCIACLKRPKINKKEAGVAHLKKITYRDGNTMIRQSEPLPT